MHTIACSRCRTQIPVSDNSSGRLIPCPNCGSPVTVSLPPPPDPLQQMQMASTTQPAMPERPTLPPRREPLPPPPRPRPRGRPVGLLAAIMFVAAVLISGVGVWTIQARLDNQNRAAEDTKSSGKPEKVDIVKSARQNVQQRFGASIERVGKTGELEDDIRLAGQMVETAQETERRDSVAAAMMLAHAAKLYAGDRDKYDAGVDAVERAMVLARSAGQEAVYSIHEIGEALRALAKSPEFNRRKPRDARDPSFFGAN